MKIGLFRQFFLSQTLLQAAGAYSLANEAAVVWPG